MYDFHERLSWSLAGAHEPFWQAVYKKAFPNLSHTELCDDLAKQKQGVDRVLYLANGNVLYVDEKKRERDYPDILLEYVSADTYRTPGWMEKDLAMDYLAYAFMPSQRCYLFPWPILRRAWLLNKQAWIGSYKTVRGENRGYTTLSVAIPKLVLRQAVSQAAIIDVSGELNHG